MSSGIRPVITSGVIQTISVRTCMRHPRSCQNYQPSLTLPSMHHQKGEARAPQAHRRSCAVSRLQGQVEQSPELNPQDDPSTARRTLALVCCGVPRCADDKTKAVETNATLSLAATWKSLMHACSAQMGSHPAMHTREPDPRRAKAHTLPTSTYPHNSASFRPMITSVALMMPSWSG